MKIPNKILLFEILSEKSMIPHPNFPVNTFRIQSINVQEKLGESLLHDH